MSETVHEIFQRIQHLPPAERLELEDLLAQQAEEEWQREAADARRSASQKGIDQAAIDRAVENGKAFNGVRETERAAALDQFLELARSSNFRSASPYPTRDELHECH